MLANISISIGDGISIIMDHPGSEDVKNTLGKLDVHEKKSGLLLENVCLVNLRSYILCCPLDYSGDWFMFSTDFGLAILGLLILPLGIASFSIKRVRNFLDWRSRS